MNLKIVKKENLPKLAWLAQLKENKNNITLFCGSWVEARSHFFVEGAWDGDFNDANFDTSVIFMGSGGIVNSDYVTFVTPCNTIEALYSIKHEDTYYISNSIPFLLETTKENLNFNYLDYENDFLSISDGLNKFINKIPLNSGNKIELHYFENIIVHRNLKLIKEKKPTPPNFKNYNDYYSFLISKLKQIDYNFASKKREKVYAPIVFSSNGYDSAACAALGKEIGCKTAIVYESKKSREDTGKPIVENLGYETIIEKEELDYLKTNNTEEFVSNGELGTSIFFAASEPYLTGTYVLSGIHGDWVWDKHAKPNKEILRSFYPDTARKEFRLRVGFHFITIPFFAVQSHYDLHRISNSEEMKPWSVGTDYDRPIARRILEDRGVPRELFGIEKDGGAGSSLRFLNLNYLKRVMPKKCYADFKIYYKKHKKKRRKGIRYFLRSIRYSIYIIKIVLRQKKIIRSFKEPQRIYTCSPWAPSFLFYWGVDKIRKKYRLDETIEVK